MAGEAFMIRPQWNGCDIPKGVYIQNLAYKNENTRNSQESKKPEKVFVELDEVQEFYTLKKDEFVVAQAAELIEPRSTIMNILAHIKRGEIKARYMLVKQKGDKHSGWKYILTMTEIERINRDRIMARKKCGAKPKKV